MKLILSVALIAIGAVAFLPFMALVIGYAYWPWRVFEKPHSYTTQSVHSLGR